MKTKTPNAFLLIVTSGNIARFPVSWLLTWPGKPMNPGVKQSATFWTPALACMLLLMVLSGCKMTRSLQEMPQDLEDVATLKEPMEQVAALEPRLKAVAALDAPLKNVADLKAPMEQVAALDPTLKAIAALDAPLKNVADLKAPIKQVAALDPTLKAVAALDAPLKNVAELEAPLVALGAMATITQPRTYVPMFGFVGVVLFLAIWGGIKMGRR